MRKNEEIMASEVRVIGEDGEQLGVLPLKKAIELAFEKGLDLVEISPNAEPPVCRIIDFGKFRFERERKAKEAKKNQKQVEIKEIRFTATIEEHDIEVKLKKAREFLEDGDKVLFKLRFRGREIVHSDVGVQLFEKIIQDLDDVGIVEKRPFIEGKFLTMMMISKKK
ncbi:MAG: translation initiation factor IF-3 [Spirochaetes bacterium]|nr:translation initiation factor IF-3 [Spirochaetota bacterium]NLJ04787.1 translation initiation factor IF-3 [Exilispira sp.]HNV44241.1 translation initiation factor IF-3 [Exilispira sp.]HPB47351.1 translation initiation factor IF-3 [Exilispira sp.]HQM90077.1 translation initiation factor IF-3 [Exilispira sp.]